jgi:hypothetical protein
MRFVPIRERTNAPPESCRAAPPCPRCEAPSASVSIRWIEFSLSAGNTCRSSEREAPVLPRPPRCSAPTPCWSRGRAHACACSCPEHRGHRRAHETTGIAHLCRDPLFPPRRPRSAPAAGPSAPPEGADRDASSRARESHGVEKAFKVCSDSRSRKRSVTIADANRRYEALSLELDRLLRGGA